jgi:hypothetical protein
MARRDSKLRKKSSTKRLLTSPRERRADIDFVCRQHWLEKLVSRRMPAIYDPTDGVSLAAAVNTATYTSTTPAVGNWTN